MTISYSPPCILRALEMCTLKCGAVRKAARRGGSLRVLQGWLLLRGLHYKHQCVACGICVMHVHGGTAPGVVTPSGELGKVIKL